MGGIWWRCDVSSSRPCWALVIQRDSKPANRCLSPPAPPALLTSAPIDFTRRIAGILCSKRYVETAVDSRELSSYQPCSWDTQPEILDQVVDTLGEGGLETDYPYSCSKGVYGGRSSQDQSSPVCSGLCPKGLLCPNLATIEPIACPAAHYCELGSAEPVPW